MKTKREAEEAAREKALKMVKNLSHLDKLTQEQKKCLKSKQKKDGRIA